MPQTVERVSVRRRARLVLRGEINRGKVNEAAGVVMAAVQIEVWK